MCCEVEPNSPPQIAAICFLTHKQNIRIIFYHRHHSMESMTVIRSTFLISRTKNPFSLSTSWCFPWNPHLQSRHSRISPWVARPGLQWELNFGPDEAVRPCPLLEPPMFLRIPPWRWTRGACFEARECRCWGKHNFTSTAIILFIHFHSPKH